MRLSMRIVYKVMYYIFTGIKRRAYDRNQCNFCQGIFVSGTVMRLSMRMVYKVMYYIFTGIKRRAYDRN